MHSCGESGRKAKGVCVSCPEFYVEMVKKYGPDKLDD